MDDRSKEEATPPGGASSDENAPLEPLPTKIRFASSYRAVRGQRTDISLRVFLGLILLIVAAGWRGFAVIGEFLSVVRQNLDAPKPSPTPITRLKNGRWEIEYPPIEERATPAIPPAPDRR